MTFQFEKLLVYQKAVDFADQVCAVTEQFSHDYGFLADQLNRTAPSIAEGNGRFTKADRKNFFFIARGSVQECVPLLELARRHGLLDVSLIASIRINEPDLLVLQIACIGLGDPDKRDRAIR